MSSPSVPLHKAAPAGQVMTAAQPVWSTSENSVVTDTAVINEISLKFDLKISLFMKLHFYEVT